MTLELKNACDLFQSPIFRDSEVIQALCDMIGPVWTTTEKEWGAHGHFTSFFGVLVVRTWYTNPVYHDLYVLHELWHRKTLNYEPGRSWLAWSKDLIASELASSLMSECLVYFYIPGLREQTFKHEIWVDRFLPNGAKSLGIRWPLTVADGFDLSRALRAERLRALNAPDHDDFLEHQIANYGRQNMLWCRAWSTGTGLPPDPDRPAFRVVDDRMSLPNWREGHPEWLAFLSDYITYPMTPMGRDPDGRVLKQIPFPIQAKLFKPIHEQSMRDFGNDVLSR